MITLNKDGSIVYDADESIGKITNEMVPVIHEWIIDEEECGHWNVIEEYPQTNGKVVEWIIDSCEQGHWVTKKDSGEIVEHFDGVIPDELSKERYIRGVWEYQVYEPYTPNELEEIRLSKIAKEESIAKSEKIKKFLDVAPEHIDSMDETQGDILLLLSDIIGGA